MQPTILQWEAEQAFMTMNYAQAKDKYLLLLKELTPYLYKGSQTIVVNYIEASMRLAKIYEISQDIEGAIASLDQALASIQDLRYRIPLDVLKSKFLCQKNKPCFALVYLIKIKNLFPLEQWNSEDRSFFNALEILVSDQFNHDLTWANCLSENEKYLEAIDSYQKILETLQEVPLCETETKFSFLKKYLQYKIAENYYYTKHYDRCLQHTESSESSDPIDLELIYLGACAYKEREDYYAAIHAFQKYLSIEASQKLEHFHEALFELGLMYLKTGQNLKAKELFLFLKNDTGANTKFIDLVTIKLATMHLEVNEIQEAQQLLSHIDFDLPSDSLITSEALRLYGISHLELGKYLEAEHFFLKALKQPMMSINWYANVKYYLAQIRIAQGHLAYLEKSNYEMYFTEAEKQLYLLQHTLVWPAAALEIAKIYLFKINKLGEKFYIQSIDFLLNDAKGFSERETLEASFILAECHPEIAEETYSFLVNKPHVDKTLMASCFLKCGLYWLQQGIKNENIDALEKAMKSLELSLCNQTEKEKNYTHLYLAIGSLYSHDIEKALATLALVKNTLDPNYLLYMKALILEWGKIPQQKEANQIFTQLENVLFKNKAFFVQAMQAYQNQNYEIAFNLFQQIQEEEKVYPTALFWLGITATHLHKPQYTYYKKLYTDYPEHEYADHAYFLMYEAQEYEGGSVEGLDHLRAMYQFFPNSSFLISCYYYLAKHTKDPSEKELLFHKALSFPRENIPSRIFSMIFGYYQQAQLDLAKQYMNQMKFDLARECCDSLTALYLNEKKYPSYLQEADYLIGKIYLKTNDLPKAKKSFADLTIKCHKLMIEQSRFLSLTWLELGKLALTEQDFNAALECLNVSEKVGENLLRDREKLYLWIMQSDLHKQKKDYVIAMKLLSKTINANVASSLRLEAMYKRAEIYELQERHDLAIRQLEATVKKGGSWSKKAKDKLRKNYGF